MHLLQMCAASEVGHTGQRERVGPAVHGYLCAGLRVGEPYMAMG